MGRHNGSVSKRAAGRDAIPATDWRLALAPGDAVTVRMDGGAARPFRVRSVPWQLGHGEWVIGLVGISGGYALSRVVSPAAKKEGE